MSDEIIKEESTSGPLDQPCFEKVVSAIKRAPMVVTPICTHDTVEMIKDYSKMIESGDISEREAKDIVLKLRSHVDVFSHPHREALPGEEWTLTPTIGNKRIGVRRAQPLTADTPEARRERASFDVSGRRPIQIPLWNSGFNITIKPMSELEASGFQMRLLNSRAEIGVSTYGISLTAEDTVLRNEIIDEIYNRIKGSSVRSLSLDSFRKLFKITDSDICLAYLLGSIYPYGYPHVQRCVNVYKGTCTFGKQEEDGSLKTNAMYNFTRGIAFKTSELTEERHTMVFADTNSVTVEDVLAFQENTGKTFTTESYEIPRGTARLVIETPSLEKYRKETRAWVNSVRTRANEILMVNDQDASTEEVQAKRLALLEEASEVFRLRRLASWIKCVEITTDDDETLTFNDEEHILEVLDMLSIDLINSYSEKEDNDIESEIENFMFDASIYAVGFSDWECPVCKSGQIDSSVKQRRVIPFNLLNVFLLSGC